MYLMKASFKVVMSDEGRQESKHVAEIRMVGGETFEAAADKFSRTMRRLHNGVNAHVEGTITITSLMIP